MLLRRWTSLRRQVRWAIIGAVIVAVVGVEVGQFAGSVLNEIGYPPTQWVALVVLGVLAAMVGGLVGFLFGVLVNAMLSARERDGVISDPES